jgi:YHS domain-containing protein
MKARWLLLLAFAGALTFGSSAFTAEEKEKEFDCKCVVSGAPAKEDKFVETSGKKVYFCCENCPKAYEKDPDKFAAKVHHQWAKTDQIVQVACPFSGEALDPEQKVEVDGVSVAFCCENCKAKAEKDSDAIALIFADIEKGYTLQNLCPVSGAPIKADKVAEHDGKKVYFCCDNCPKAFAKDPAKFLSKLPQFAEKAEK